MNLHDRRLSNVWAAIGAGAATIVVVAINPPPAIGLLAVGVVVAVATPYMTLDSGRFLAMIIGCGFVAIAERTLEGRGRSLAEFGGFVVLLTLASHSRRWAMRFRHHRATRRGATATHEPPRSLATSRTTVSNRNLEREDRVEICDQRAKKPLKSR